MTLPRIKKREENLAILDKSFLEDSAISWGAKGIYSYLIGFPDHIDLLKILRLSKDDQSSTHSYIEELEEAGYLTRDINQDELTIKQE